MKYKVGDFVQYRTNTGEVKGYGLVIGKTEYWTILRDNKTNKDIYWGEDLMIRISQ